MVKSLKSAVISWFGLYGWSLASVFLLTSPPPAGAIAMPCYAQMAKVKKLKPHKAFVHGQRSDTEYCGWSWGQPTRQVAIEAAIKECKNAGAWNCTVRFAE